MAEASPELLDRLCGDRFFMSRAFAELWRARGGWPVVWLARRAGEVAAILPGVEFGCWGLKRFMSMPDGCYGGVLCEPHCEGWRIGLTRALLDGILRERYVKTYLFDFDGALGSHERFGEMPLATTLVDISNPDWLPPDRKLQAQIRKAEKEGIKVEPMAWDRHGDRFMDLMSRTAQRIGYNPVYNREFYAAVARTAAIDDRLHWVWCEHLGRAVCSHIYVVERGILQGWQISFDKHFSFLKPNQYIRFTVCREMASQGVVQLNLGGTPENAPGLTYYKKRWGGQQVSYRGLVHKQGIGRIF